MTELNFETNGDQQSHLPGPGEKMLLRVHPDIVNHFLSSSFQSPEHLTWAQVGSFHSVKVKGHFSYFSSSEENFSTTTVAVWGSLKTAPWAGKQDYYGGLQ